MHRFRHLMFVTLITATVQVSNADESRSVSQSFVVHVPPKVSIESVRVPPQPSTETNAPPTGEPVTANVEKAFRLSGTSSAGITAWVEVQPSSADESGFAPKIGLIVADDERGRWTVTNHPSPDHNVLKVSSSGTGSATLILSSDGGSQETVIVTTVISNE